MLAIVSEPVNVHFAKTHLSELLARVERGESITIARAGTPVARLVAIHPPAERELGFLAGGSVPPAFFEPLDASDLAAWGEV